MMVSIVLLPQIKEMTSASPQKFKISFQRMEKHAEDTQGKVVE